MVSFAGWLKVVWMFCHCDISMMMAITHTSFIGELPFAILVIMFAQLFVMALALLVALIMFLGFSALHGTNRIWQELQFALLVNG
jgi:hypothetical protein